MGDDIEPNGILFFRDSCVAPGNRVIGVLGRDGENFFSVGFKRLVLSQGRGAPKHREEEDTS